VYSYSNVRLHLNKITELCLYFAHILQFYTIQRGRLTLKILGQIHNLFYFQRFLTGLMHRTLHDHPSQLCFPDALSLVCDPLSGNRCGSQNHI